MAEIVCNGAQIVCSMGAAPATLVSGPQDITVKTAVQPVATINDHIPTTNIPTFGLCFSVANPQVAAATAAAQGVLTPQPCRPNTASPWVQESLFVKSAGVPALVATAQCACMWGGVITVVSPGQLAAQSM